MRKDFKMGNINDSHILERKMESSHKRNATKQVLQWKGSRPTTKYTCDNKRHGEA